MHKKQIRHFARPFVALIIVLINGGCAGNPSAPSPAPATPASSSFVVTEIASASAPDGLANTPIVSPSPAEQPVPPGDLPYEDNFENPSSGWTKATYDNSFVGYHEPYYHIEVQSIASRALAIEPGRRVFSDVTVEIKAYTHGEKTDPEGDFRYGIVFRRSGEQYYAFTISPRTKNWYMLKSSPSAFVILKEGPDDSLHGLSPETMDSLRVDTIGSTFFLHINGHLVDRVSDTEYAAGEVGFFVQTINSAQAHAHFDSIVIQNAQSLQPQAELQYEDHFENPSSGWPKATYDNYFVGYHEPYYHIEVQRPASRTLVPEPGKGTFSDATVEIMAYIHGEKTHPEGDFRYGIVFRRSGDQYYAFTISLRTKKWFMLKSSPSALVILKDGSQDSLQGLSPETMDTLRVDANGATFFFYINGRFIDQFSDLEYASGETGFYVETIDSVQAHIHFDSITIRDLQPICIFLDMALHLRIGPGLEFAAISSLVQGDTMEPLGISPDREWIRVRVEESNQLGWVAADFVDCNIPKAELQIVGP